jgi:malonyl-CoA/methylmalonyl-CoA synthetase
MPNPLHDAFLAPLEGRARPFLYLPDGTAMSGAAFHDLCARTAGAMVALGVGPGDRVAVQVEKSAAALALYGGAVLAGAVFLPMNTAYTPAEVGYFVTDAEAALLICDAASEAALAPVAAAAGARLTVLNADGSGSFAGAVALAPPLSAVDQGAGDLAGLLYTSGTTGRSKGAMMTHANLMSNAQVLARDWRFTEADVLLHALPIFHTHGLFVATNVTLAAGGAMILLPKFDLDAVFAHLPQATAMMGVPTFYTRMLDDPRLTREAVAHMRLFVSGSAPLLAETHAAFKARTGQVILERYGMTETNMNTSNPYEGARKPGTVGPPLPGVEVIVTDPETGAPLPQGEIGMVEVRGPNVFEGYWRMPEKTAAELRPNGFFITGDLGRFDADGYLTIVGRQKDMIIAGGFNIYPVEVEEALDAHPDILESAVVGVPHPDLGEAVVGVIVPAPGSSPDPTAILADLGRTLARFKLPRALEVVQELPRNTMGKVQKAALRERLKMMFVKT